MTLCISVCAESVSYDVNSKTVENTGNWAVIKKGKDLYFSGENDFVSNINLEKGDKIITSGIGGVFPVGLPVGEVASVEKNIVKIKPANNLSRMEYVMIVDYKLPDPADELYGDVSK